MKLRDKKVEEISDGLSISQKIIKKRDLNAHKGTYGRVLIVAGTKEMAGAALMAGKAAIKTGSGLVHVCTEKKVFPIIQGGAPELICTTWAKEIKRLNRYDAIGIGPGMGVNLRTFLILKTLLINYKGKLVIDADGLNTVSRFPVLQALLKKTEAEVVITPHIGEAERLIGTSLKDIPKKYIADYLERKFDVIAVVKGKNTAVYREEKGCYLNNTGNPGMATAGSGDVLTGIMVSLAGQHDDLFEAAVSAVYIHGLSGDMAEERLGEYGMTAGNIIGRIPFALKQIEK